jgi:hypothetical protein
MEPQLINRQVARKCRGRKKTQEEQKNERYRRQIQTLLRKINRMGVVFDADIFIYARRKRKQTLYTTSEDLTWPVGIKDMIVGSEIAYSPLS